MNCLPAYIDNELWDAFWEMRKKMGNRAPVTDFAKKLVLKELMKFHGEGYDANNSLEQSIMKGWRGVFKGEMRSEIKPVLSPELQQIKDYSLAQPKSGPPPAIRAQIDAMLKAKREAA
jgi:hypothetical protein